MQFNWNQEGANWVCEMPGDISLCVSPSALQGWSNKPKRGATWISCVSRWEPNKSGHGGTLTRLNKEIRWRKTKAEAMKDAEEVYASL